MVGSFESGALLGHVYTLQNGMMVRLRLARSSDALAVKQLLERQQGDSDEVEMARLVHFDPRRRYVLAATGLVGSTQSLLGIGSIGLDDGPQSQPDLLVVDEGRDDVAQLLRRALVGCAAAGARSRAA